MGFFRLKLTPKLLLIFFRILKKPCDTLILLFFGKDDLGCGKYHDAFKFLDGTLAHDIEASDGIHFIAPKFDTDRILFRKGINVYYAAAYRELAALLDLITAIIAKGHELLLKAAKIYGVRHAYIEHMILKSIYGDNVFHKSIKSCYYRRGFTLYYGFKT